MIAARRTPWFAALVAALAAAAITPTARAEDWEPTPDGAGVIDHDTGLVWGALNSSFGGPAGVDWATAEAGSRQYGLTAYNATGQYSTGWRMPTRAESQTAVSHNAWHYFNLAWAEGNPVCWTATKQSSSYWAIQFMTGATGLLNGKSGRADFRPVRSLESWTYREDLGGWLDNQTGLVWGRSSGEMFGWTLRWSAIPGALRNYHEATGNTAWRAPTLDEVKTAIDHNAVGYFFDQTPGNASTTGYYWTATESNKQSAWCVRFHSGETRAISKDSAIWIMPVYRP